MFTLFPTRLEITTRMFKVCKKELVWEKSLRQGLKIFFYQLALSTAPAATNGLTGNLYVTSRGIFTPSYTENVLIKVVVQQKDILGVICILSFKNITLSKHSTYFSLSLHCICLTNLNGHIF